MSLAVGQPYCLMQWALWDANTGKKLCWKQVKAVKLGLWEGRCPLLQAVSFICSPWWAVVRKCLSHLWLIALRQCIKMVSICWKCIWWCVNGLPGCLGRDSVTHMWWCPQLSEASAQADVTQHQQEDQCPSGMIAGGSLSAIIEYPQGPKWQ